MNIVGVMVMLSVACLTMLSTSCQVKPSVARDGLSADRPALAMKVRHPEWFTSDSAQVRLIEFCLEYRVNRLIVPAEPIGDPSLDQTPHDGDLPYAKQMSQLVERATEHGIAVEVMPDTANIDLEQDHATVLAQLDAILAFNQNLPRRAQLTGVHYEMSLHQDPQWNTPRRPKFMRQALDLLTQLKTAIRQSKQRMLLSIAIPHWYDNRLTQNDSCVVEYYGQTKNFHEHIQDLSDHVTVLCYRPGSDTEDPISEQAQTELEYAQWIDRTITIEMETSREDDVRATSYYGRPAREFWLHKQEAEQLLKNRQGFGGVVISAYEPFRELLSQQAVQTDTRPTQRIFGMWVWDKKWVKNEQEHDQLLAFCQTYGINLLPIQVHLDPASVKRGQPKLLYPGPLRRLIQKASTKGIRVEALDGAPEMGLVEHRTTVLAILDAIVAFEHTLPPGAGLAGVHYDIEPYLLPQWKTDQRHQIMHQFLQLLEAARLKLKLDAPRLTLSASIPFWYDEKIADDDHCILTYNGKRKNFHQHIQDLTDFVAVMSYRRQALGEDSITHHVEAERAYAEWIGRYVCAGMETMQIKERPEVSFYGVPPAEFWFQKQKVNQALDHRGGFGGVVVHSYETFRPFLAKSLSEPIQDSTH